MAIDPETLQLVAQYLNHYATPDAIKIYLRNLKSGAISLSFIFIHDTWGQNQADPRRRACVLLRGNTVFKSTNYATTQPAGEQASVQIFCISVHEVSSQLLIPPLYVQENIIVTD
jgi:hypothetical protein